MLNKIKEIIRKLEQERDKQKKMTLWGQLKELVDQSYETELKNYR